MIGTIDIEVQAKNPNMPLWPLRAYVNSPSSIRVRNVPKRVGDWNISRVYLTVVYPDGTIKQADCVQTGGVWVGTVEGTATSGTCENGYTVFADGTDENGNPVTGYVLGKGDVEILEADGTLSPDPARYYVKLLSAEAAEPREGDMYPTEGGYVIWQNGQANLLGTPFDQITSYVESAVSAKADLSALDDYAKTDELSSKADLSAIPTNTSQLSNDSGFITSAEIAPYHYSLTPTENTGLAKTAYTLALADIASAKPVEDGTFSATLRTYKDLTKQFRATMTFATYHPYVMSMYNGQTLSPELSLYFCKDSLKYGTTRPRPYYDGYMFRTGGAGFAIPCSEDGTPDGRLVETTDVQPNWVLMENNTTSIHSIGFSTSWEDPYGNIITIDEQSDMIYAHRTNAYKTYSMGEELANKSELPTKTSELSNDSGFVEQNGTAVINSLTCDQLVANQAHIVGYATESELSTKRDLNDLNIYVDPMEGHTPIEVTVWHTSEISTLYVLNWDGSSWYYTDGSTSIQIYFDGYSNHYILTGSVQDMGGTQRSIGGQFDLTSPLWSVTFEAQYFYKIEVASVKAHIVTREYVDSRLSALEARIAALEGN